MICDEKKIINRLNRAEGQLRGVTKMIEEGQDCKDVLAQVTAVRSSIDKIVKLIGINNLLDCIDTLPEGIDGQEALEEAVELIVKSR